jgi:hypothetical protein
LFRLALKIILVGTRIVLSPHEYFQFDQTLKNVVVNSESAFWVFYEKHLLGYFPKRLLEGLGAKKPPWRGPQERVGRPLCGLPHGAPLAPSFPLYALVEVFLHGHFWDFGSAHSTPCFSYK